MKIYDIIPAKRAKYENEMPIICFEDIEGETLNYFFLVWFKFEGVKKYLSFMQFEKSCKNTQKKIIFDKYVVYYDILYLYLTLL